MGHKETLLAELSEADRSSCLPQLHSRLIEQGLKFKAPSNSQTLLYYVKNTEGKDIGLSALRVRGGVAVFSFPKNYWKRRASAVTAALSQINDLDILEIEPSDPSSKESTRQVRVSAATFEHLVRAVEGLIKEHAVQFAVAG
jgi:hypothetical protein